MSAPSRPRRYRIDWVQLVAALVMILSYAQRLRAIADALDAGPGRERGEQ